MPFFWLPAIGGKTSFCCISLALRFLPPYNFSTKSIIEPRKYESPDMQHQRLMGLNETLEEVREELKGIYLTLNPAQLKRSIEAKLAELYQIYEEKRGTLQVTSHKKLAPVRLHLI